MECVQCNQAIMPADLYVAVYRRGDTLPMMAVTDDRVYMHATADGCAR